MTFPQLRIRTEYNFRDTYGPIARVAERLAVMKTPAAGIVDRPGTWGHISWERELRRAGVDPIFGAEFKLDEVGRYWALAEDMRGFYRFSSAPPRTPQELCKAQGIVRFAGQLTNPELFDYIDINPCSRIKTLRALMQHRATRKPLALTCDNDYPAPDDRERFLAWNDGRKLTPQHIATLPELRAAMPYVSDAHWKKAVRGTCEVAERCGGLKLAHAPLIKVKGNLGKLVEVGRKHRLGRKHIKRWTKKYQDRLDRELKLIREKKYESYFLVVADTVTWAKRHMLVGPARGSSAGSLVCYLLQITEVDPLVHNLLFERFISVNRDDLPDIDVDFNDRKRPEVFAYLAEKYGADNIARIGNVLRLKPRSVMAHVGKKLGIPHGATFPVLNVLMEHPSGDARYGHDLEDTLTTTQPGRDFLEWYPEAAIMGELENHASHSGVHAAGVIVSHVPVIDYCTVRDGVAHVNKKDAEALNLLKIDVLGLRTLGVIEDSGMITPQELYDLKLNDPEVLETFNAGKFAGVFQFEGNAQRRVASEIHIEHFRQLDHITALARPGPLGADSHITYANRHSGKEKVTYQHSSMKPYLKDTLGVVLYQEQVMRIVREIGGFSWEDTATIRKAMSASKGSEFFDRLGKQFIKGADLPKKDAQEIWTMLVTFGGWGMNRSHTVSYAIISYWCGYMKRYHPLEYAAALLRNAKDDEQIIEMLRELRDEGVSYVPFDADLSAQSWVAANGKLIGGYTNLVGIGPIKAQYYVARREAGELTDTDREKLAARVSKFAELNPAHQLWGHIYDDPGAYNINGRVDQFGEFANDRASAVIVGQFIRADRRDENEAVRMNRRGKTWNGQSLFLDTFMVDDSVSKPIRVRLRPRMWFTHGERLADRAVPKQDWFLIRGKWLAQFQMLIVHKIKCLTNEEMFA